MLCFCTKSTDHMSPPYYHELTWHINYNWLRWESFFFFFVIPFVSQHKISGKFNLAWISQRQLKSTGRYQAPLQKSQTVNQLWRVGSLCLSWWETAGCSHRDIARQPEEMLDKRATLTDLNVSAVFSARTHETVTLIVQSLTITFILVVMFDSLQKKT